MQRNNHASGVGPQQQGVQAPQQQLERGTRFNTWFYTLLYNLPVYLFIAAIVTAFITKTAIHQIPEGHVGVYWRGGAMLDLVADPGFHLKIPFVDTYEAVQVTLQTDKVTNIPCGTVGGVIIYFEKIEVVNRLDRAHVHGVIKEYGIYYDRTWIYDKIHHEINQFCTSHTLQEVYITKFDQIDEKMKEALQQDLTKYVAGLNIISVRITKPRIPESIKTNYELMEEERTRALVAAERQKVMEIEAETERKRAVLEAQKEIETSKIANQRRLQEIESKLQQQQIENEIYVAKQKALADAEAYRVRCEAEANKLKLSSEYLQWTLLQSISNNTKIFFGQSIPDMLFRPSVIQEIIRDS
eukprot:TRINITY_DN4696_c0_g1_i1.p2 TRINITY_DN4696_c0_g1~~TRINITY_DN4696_c0_g1_i1.p2  ORF type:complete len:356 (+),score=39.82 TRINITY_DN4696_c0_g1_i1:84-1151(+)